MELKPGDRIERYVIDSLLGAGGMGQVYRAHDTRLQRNVALKILHRDAASLGGETPGGGARMLREARAAAALEHPNVVSVYDVGMLDEPKELRGTTYIAMELIRGSSLRSFVGDFSVPIEKRIRWLVDVARALHAAHVEGLIHRDIKPENIMVREDGLVKVLDFGIAKRTSPSKSVTPDEVALAVTSAAMTAAGVVIGTPLYMSPEQMLAADVDARSDQFAWAVVAYELLVGRHPWSFAEGPVHLIAQILNVTPAPLSGQKEIPEHVANAITRALSKDPAERFATLAAAADAMSGATEPTSDAPSEASGANAANAANAASAANAVISSSKKLPPSAVVTIADAPPTSTPTGPVEPSEKPRAGRSRATLVALLVLGIVGVGFLARYGSTGLREKTAPGPSASALLQAGCTSARACVLANAGAPFTCRMSDHACVPLASKDCTPFFEPADLTADDTVWIGGMFPTKGPLAKAFGLEIQNGADFARKEIADATASLGGEGAAQRVRHIGLVACDDSEDPMRAAHHLVDDVGAPAIIGYRSGQEVVDLAGSFLIGRGVLSVATTTANPAITKLPHPPGAPRLVYRTTPGQIGAAETCAAVIPAVLEPTRASSRARTRVALVRVDMAVAFGEAFFSKLTFNGKSALQNGDDYFERTFPAGELPAADASRLAREIAAKQPTFIVVLGPTQTAVSLVKSIDDEWRGSPKPTYVMAIDTLKPFASLMGPHGEERQRFFSVIPVSDTPQNARFVIRYNSAHHDQVTRSANPSPTYDAFYATAYATFSLGRAAITGASLSHALGQLVGPGRTLEVGPTDVLDAVSILSNGARIDLNGAASSLDFDLETGELNAEYDLVCPALGSDDGDVASGVIWSTKTSSLRGSLHCP